MSIRSISPNELEKILSHGRHYALIDVTEADVFANGHLPGSFHFPWADQYASKFSENFPNRNTMYIFYGIDESDASVKNCTDALHQASYVNLYFLEGGKSAWSKAGHNLVS